MRYILNRLLPPLAWRLWCAGILVTPVGYVVDWRYDWWFLHPRSLRQVRADHADIRQSR